MEGGGPMRKLAMVALVAVVGLGACGIDNNKDLKSVPNRHPDKIENFENMDGHPNIGYVCIKGVAFATTTRQNNAAIQRVPEWDKTCPQPAAG
jgi:hypothetical protein